MLTNTFRSNSTYANSTVRRNQKGKLPSKTQPGPMCEEDGRRGKKPHGVKASSPFSVFKNSTQKLRASDGARASAAD